MRAGRVSWIAALLTSTLLAVSGCTTTASDAGCLTYGSQRSAMPRPLGEGPLPQWVAVTDAAMTGACR